MAVSASLHSVIVIFFKSLRIIDEESKIVRAVILMHILCRLNVVTLQTVKVK